MPGKTVMTLSRSFVDPFLRIRRPPRPAREGLQGLRRPRRQWQRQRTTTEIIVEILSLREESAKPVGFPDLRGLPLEDSMAKTPEAVRGLLERVWKPARARALADRDDLQALVAEEGGNFALAPWDWRYYRRKAAAGSGQFRRCRDQALSLARSHDRGRVRLRDPPVRRLRSASARISRSGIRTSGSGKSRTARASIRPLFYGDYFARPSKRSGAWMTSLRDQQKLDGDIAPLVLNICNFTKGADGQPSLLSPDDARTLFHEFGHGLHGMLSNVTYPSLSGTSVFTDFVELPSQLLRALARSSRRCCGNSRGIPDRRAAAGRSAEAFSQRAQNSTRVLPRGEFVASALIDLEFHTQPAAASRDVRAFEQAELEKLGMPAEISLRHRPQHFGHIFSGDHYASGYYSYMWSEVMDADAFGALKRPATSSIRPSPSGCMTTSIRRAARAIRKMPMSRSAAASRSPTRCCAAAVCSRPRKRPEMIAAMRCSGVCCCWPACWHGPSEAQAHPHCLDHRQERADLCTRWLDHRRAARLDFRRHVLDLCVAGTRYQGKGRLQPRRTGAAGADQCRIAEGIWLPSVLPKRTARRKNSRSRSTTSWNTMTAADAALHAAAQDR